MSAVVNTVVDLAGDAIEGFIDIVEDTWNYVVVPLLEEVFSWFGIEDETAVHTQKISTLIFEGNTVAVVQRAKEKAAMSMSLNGGSYFKWYILHTRQTQNEFKEFYKFADHGRYIHGLPNMEVKGGDMDYSVLDAALDTDLGFPVTRLTWNTAHPPVIVYFRNKLQAAPHNYTPQTNTLTFTDPYGVSRDDYILNIVTYNRGNDTYDVEISREAEEALFWIEGPVHIVEGDSATYTIKCNRTVPIGKSVSISLVYGGTAPPTDYTEVTAAVITAGNTEVDIVVTTNEDTQYQGSRTIIVTIDSVDNTELPFEAVGIYALNSISTTITDDEGRILTMSSAVVTEAEGSITIPVKLENSFPFGFTVGYAMIDGTAIGGVDFDDTPGTLDFVGTAGEVKNIVIPITSDSPDDNENFTVYFTYCTSPFVNYTQTALVTITDGSNNEPVAGTVTLNNVIVEPGYVSENSLMVTYHANTDPSTEWFYWIYKLSSDLYPGIQPVSKVASKLAMLPIGILRKDKISVNVDKTTGEYKSTRKLLNILGLDIDVIIKNVEESPDIDKLDDVFINFAICPSTDEESISKLLWLTYYSIIVIQNITSNDNRYNVTFQEQDIKSSVVWTDHGHTIGIAGNIPNGAEYSHEIVIIPEILDENGDVTQEEGSFLYIRHQISVDIYDELWIENLNGMAAIAYDGFHKVALSKLGRSNFTIPLSYFILDQLDPLEQMEVYQYILRIDVYAIDIQHIEWYETSSFSTLFSFAMIIITIWTLGATSPWVVLQNLVINYLIMEIVVYIAELTGNAELAAIVGLVAMMAISPADGGIGFDFASAVGLLRASTQFANNLTAGYDVLYEGLSEDLIELNEEAEQRLEEISDAAPEESPITAEFLVALNSVDTTAFPAIKAQYDFDLIYNYDRIIADYHDLNLQTGVT